MAIFKPPRGSDEVLSEIVLEKGEIVYNTTDGKFYTGDDQTAGGILLNSGAAAPVSGEVTLDDVAEVVLSAMEAHVEVADATYATKAELADYATKADLNAIEIPDVTGFATSEALSGVAASIPSVDGLATVESVNAVSAAVAAIEIPDVSEFATKADLNAIEIPDVTGFATSEALSEVAASIPSIAGLASEEELAVVSAAIPDVTGFATTTALEEVSAAIPEVSGFATKAELSAHVAAADAKYAANDVLSAYATKSALESVYATKLEVSEFYDLAATKEALAEHAAEADDKYATKAEVSTKIDDADLDPIRVELEKKLEAEDIEGKLDADIYDDFVEDANGRFASKYNLSKTDAEVAELKAAHAADVASLKAEIKVIKTAAKVEPYVPGESPAPTANDDVYIESNAAISGNTTIAVKSLVVEDATISAPSGSVLVVTAQEEVVMDGTTFETHETKNANVAQVKDAETVILKGITFTGNSYNTLMTGQLCAEGKYIKDMVIEDCHFDDTCAHISIWFAAFQDNATLTIRNCTFKDCEQVLCISDFHKQFDNKLTVKIENCTIENYDNYKPNNAGWYGIMFCDSRNTTSMEDFKAKNPFGDGKVTIIIDNVTAKGVKLTQSNFIMGTTGTDQMLYVYVASARNNIFMDDPENAKYFPTVIVK